MKHKFLLADSPAERLVIAILAANTQYAKKHSDLPEADFYREFLEPFLEYEFRKVRLEELHLIQATVTRKRERELAEAVAFWGKKCIQKLNGHG